jgi:hypothetical protein
MANFNKRNVISSFESDQEDVYDWILDIDLITNINMSGWKVYFSDKFSKESLPWKILSNNKE